MLCALAAVLLAAFCHLVACEHELHACKYHAARSKAPFAAACVREGHVFITPPVVHACLLAPSERVPLPADPVVLSYAPDSLVGRLYRADGGAGDDYVWPLRFAEVSERLEGAEGAAFDCYAGIAADVATGHYAYEVQVERRGWLWDPPWNGSLALGTFGGLLGPLPPPEQALAAAEATLRVEARPHRLSRPPCRDEMDGVWQAGRFVPHSCELSEVSWERLDVCLARLGHVLWLGDSNSRRASKVLFSRGAWCGAGGADGGAAAPYCPCEDCEHLCPEGNWNTESGYPWGHFWGDYARRGGAASPNASALIRVIRTEEWPLEGGVIYNGWEGLKPPPSLLILAVAGAWPESGFNLSAFQTQVRAVAKDLRVLPPPRPRLIIRTGPYFCCSRETLTSHRFSAKRQQVQTELLKRALRNAFPDALWWDTRALGEARRLATIAAQSTACAVNHMPGWLVAEDVRTLRHLICLAAEEASGGGAA